MDEISLLCLCKTMVLYNYITYSSRYLWFGNTFSHFHHQTWNSNNRYFSPCDLYHMKYLVSIFVTKWSYFIFLTSVTNHIAIFCVQHSISPMLYPDTVLPCGLSPQRITSPTAAVLTSLSDVNHWCWIMTLGRRGALLET